MAKKLVFYIFGVFLFAGCATTLPLEPVASLTRCREVKRTQESIIGGKEVGFGDPDQQLVTMLKIRRGDHESVCTGTLISDRVILTAAHCVAGVDPEDVIPHFVTTEGCPVNQARETTIEVKKSILHKNFDGTPQSLADVALLYLDEDAPKEQLRLPLLKKDEKPSSDKILLIGFGITGETQKDSQVLRRIYKSLKEDVTPRNRALLVNQANGRGGFCRGDSGAPIIAEIWGEPHVMAVNSANIGIQANTECQTMSLAMDALAFSDWIQKYKSELDRLNWLTKRFTASVEQAD